MLNPIPVPTEFDLPDTDNSICEAARHDLFEVYRLVNGQYQRQQGNPVWMPEIGLGIGVALGVHEGGSPRNWSYWYDEQDHQLPILENVIAQERQRAEQVQQFQDLLARLHERGIDLDNL